jgi:hypothetical protein
MRKIKPLIVIVALGLIPASALAHRLANRHQKAALTSAFRASLNGEPVPGRCVTARISTPDTNWADVTFTVNRKGQVPPGCLKFAANGESIFHFRSGRWRFVTSGSSFVDGNGCAVPHVPKRVVSDFKLCG